MSSEIEIPDDLIIVQLEGENVKRLYAAAISPTDEVTKIGGWNEQGKSTLIDCVEYTLCGGRSLPAEPLRRGAKKGASRVQIGSRSNGFGLTAERRYTKRGDTLTVKLDGHDEPVTAPQKLLDRLYTAGAAQPDEFLDLKPKDKLALLQRVVGVSFDDLNEQAEKLYTERTGVTREAKLLEGQVASAERYDDAPTEQVDVSALRNQIDKAAEHNQAVANQERDRERRSMQVDSLAEQARRIDEEIEGMRKRAIELKEKAADYRKQANEILGVVGDEMLEAVDTAALLTQLSEAEEANRKVLANERRRELEKQMRAKNSEVTRITLALERIVEERESRLAAAKFPVQGLSFSDDGVLLNGIPFEQASQEQQVVTAAAIRLAENPKLKAILMRRGSLLDPQHQAALRKWAKENKCQVFLEVVGKDADCEVIIEDGVVVGQKSENREDEWK